MSAGQARPLAKLPPRPPAPVVEREVRAQRAVLAGHRGVLNDHERRLAALEAQARLDDLEKQVRALRELVDQLAARVPEISA